MFWVEVCRAHAGVQAIAQLFQGLYSAHQLNLSLQNCNQVLIMKITSEQESQKIHTIF